MKKKLYCSYCGAPVEQRSVDGRPRDYCSHCDTVFYENPLPVASAIVMNRKREVLLVKRKHEPYKEMWCLPIGFAESGEEMRDAALRELREEAGVNGEIVRLIDVDTVENYFYGSLAIVTYEARIAGGSVRPGDDAAEAAFFPIMHLPSLAWSSNRRAIDIYIDLYQDTWAMLDSFRRLFPGIDSPGDMAGEAGNAAFLSNVLVKMVDTNMHGITDEWLRDVAKKVMLTDALVTELRRLNMQILRGVRKWLERGGATEGADSFIGFGGSLRRRGMKLPDVLTATALSRKSLWMRLVREKLFSTPLEIYSTLELNNRIVFFYDKINYHLASGYMEARG